MALVNLNRKRMPYADIVRAEAPLAKQAYYNRLAREQERKKLIEEGSLAKKQLAQSAEQFEKSLGAEKEQFETGLAESKRQFAESTALSRQQSEEQAKQARISQGIATAGLGIEAYPYIKKGVSALGNVLFSESAPAVAETTSLTTTGAGTTAGGGLTGGGASSGGLGGAGVAGIAAAAILGQQMAVNATDTTYKGQKTGGFFTRDEQGRWAPRFGNEPWHGYLNEQWGIAPSAGEKWDAAMYNQDWGELARRTPGTVQQWLNPIGDFGYDVIENKWGPNFAGTLDPITYGFDKLSEARDIGDVAKGLVDTSAKVIDPVGTLVGPTAKDFVEDVTGSSALGEAANVLLNPVGSIADFVSNWF